MKQSRIIARNIIVAVLIGLAVLWLHPVHAAPTVTVPVQPRKVTVPVLTLTLTPHRVSINTGETTRIDIVIANTGDGAANAVLLKVVAPVGMRVAPTTGSGNQWNLGTIPAGSTKTVTATLSVNQNMKDGDDTLNASVTAEGVATVSATSVLTIKRGQVKGATTDGSDTAMTELPKTGSSTVLFWTGSALLVAGLAGLCLNRRQKTQGV